MAMKKGQLTVFMLIGLLVVFALVFLFYLLPSVTPSTRYESIDDVQTAYEACARTVFIDALKTLGAQGGRMTVNDPVPELNTAYWYKAEERIVTRNQVENDVAQYLEQSISEQCRSLTETFSDIGVTLQTGVPHVTVTLNTRDVTAHIDYPVRAVQVNRVQELEPLVLQEPVALQSALAYATFTTEGYKETGMIPLACSTTKAVVFPHNEDIIVHIVDGLGTLSDDSTPYQFWFGLD